MTLRLLSIPLLIVALFCLGACSAKPRVDAEAIELTKLDYPDEAPRGEDYDIVVERKKGSIRLINRTASVYDKQVLWLNQQYVGKVENIQIGSDNVLSLRRFFNRWGEHFPVGGFFTPDKANPVVLAELVDPSTGARHRLVVRRQ